MAHEPTNISQGTSRSNKWTQPVELSKHNKEKSLKQWIVEDDEGLNTAIDLSQVRVKKKNNNLNQNCSNCNLIFKEETIS